MTTSLADMARRRRLTSWILGLGILLVAGLTRPAMAQAPATQGSIRGYVFDSLLTHTTLPGAIVTVVGPTNKQVTADGRGRFLVDSLAPGKYTITFSHPDLDLIGYTPPQWDLQVTAGVVTRAFLSTIAGSDVFARLCPSIRETQTGVLLGSLREIRSGRPVVNGEVRVEWTESLISRETGLSRRPKAVRTPTDSLGHYRLCGVPNDAGVLLRARAGAIDGAPLELALGGKSVAIRLLTIDLGDSVTRVADGGTVEKGTAVLSGTIRKDDGQPLPEAQVFVLGLPNATSAATSGKFELPNLPGGSHTVEIRAIGYARRREMVELVPDKAVDLDLKMTRVAAILPELTVTAKTSARLAEFDQRRLHNSGGGHFITQEQIEARNPLKTEDLFRTVAGLSVVPSGGFDYTVVSTRTVGFNGQCSPEFYIDGARVTVDAQIGGGIPVDPREIYGIEVYNGAASVPAEYQNNASCGVIVIWTRRGGGKK